MAHLTAKNDDLYLIDTVKLNTVFDVSMPIPIIVRPITDITAPGRLLQIKAGRLSPNYGMR